MLLVCLVISYVSCHNLIFYPLFLYILQKKKNIYIYIYICFSINLVILLFLFNFCVLKNHENHKKNTKIKKILLGMKLDNNRESHLKIKFENFLGYNQGFN